MKRKIPEPIMEFAETSYGMAYAWRVDAYGITVLGDTRQECIDKFPVVFEDEYNKKF